MRDTARGFVQQTMAAARWSNFVDQKSAARVVLGSRCRRVARRLGISGL